MSTAIPNTKGVIFSAASKPGVLTARPSVTDGVPSFRFCKTIARCGTFLNDGTRVTIDGSMLDHWADTYSQMRAIDPDCVTVPLEHTEEPDKNRGFVRDMFREDDELRGVFEIFGDDAPRLAKTTSVSLYSPLSRCLGDKTFTRPITHVALTTKPVITNLGPFTPLAASHNVEKETIILSEVSKMDPTPTPTTTAAPEDVNPKDAITKSFKAQAMKLWDDEKLDPVALAAQMKDLRKKMFDIIAKLGDDKPEPKPGEGEPNPDASGTIAASQASTPDPAVIKLSVENRALKIDNAVAKGQITPAQAAKLKAMFGVEQATLAFAHGVSDNFDSVLEAMSLSGGQRTGERTGAQVLSQTGMAGDDQAAKRSEAIRKQMRKDCGLPPEKE